MKGKAARNGESLMHFLNFFQIYLKDVTIFGDL